MKFKLNLLIVLVGLLSFTTYSYAQKTQAYVKFAEQPPVKLIKNDITSTEFFVEFKTKKEATIYLALKKGDKLYSNSIATVKSKKAKKLKLKLSTPFNTLIPGKGYYYELYMFEGPKNTWKKQYGTTITIEDVKVSRL